MNPNEFVFREIHHGSPEWNAVLIHRDRILRRPLGRSLSPDDLAHEEKQRHFILRDEQGIVAGLIARPPESRTIQIRQMWVREDLEGHGLGRRLLCEVADVLASEEIDSLSLHARESARGFYEKCGYQALGETFMEIGIPHILMRRPIGASSSLDSKVE